MKTNEQLSKLCERIMISRRLESVLGLDQWFSNIFCHHPLYHRTKMPVPPSSNERQNDDNVKCHKNWLILQSQTV